MEDRHPVRIFFLNLFNVMLLALVLGALSGCDPITRHKALTTLFDGVPSLPPPEQICTEYADQKVAELRNELLGKKTVAKTGPVTVSQHPPYVEKKCNDCHNKNNRDGLVAPRNQLCYVCHTNFVKGQFVHGPIAVADCLACHLPHTSTNPSLLKNNVSALCAGCHKEKRVADTMHAKLAAQQMPCTDCHDPHFGNLQYFLK